MSYRITGIDVHKKMLAVVVADVDVEGEYQFKRCRFSTSPDHLRFLAEWLIKQQVEEVVMESTAQCWKPFWAALERYWQCPVEALDVRIVGRLAWPREVDLFPVVLRPEIHHLAGELAAIVTEQHLRNSPRIGVCCSTRTTS